jgi:amidase
VAVAAGMTTLADGSDIGGSIRIPAACCGVVGYKPPVGRNPNHLAATFDAYMHYGPITRTVGDAALMQNIMAGAHVEDIASLRDPVPLPATFPPIGGWRVAVSIDLGFYQVDADVRRNTLEVAATLRQLGCRVEEVELGWTEEVFEAWKMMNALRGSAARHVPDRERWRPHLADYTLDWLDAGASISPEQTIRALEIHVEMYRTVGPLLEEFEILLCPTNAVPSVEADRSPVGLELIINGEPASPVVAEAWFMTYPFNMLSQLPVMSVPSGLASNGVPTGVQLVGRSYDDGRVFQAAAALEQALRWDQRHPAI